MKESYRVLVANLDDVDTGDLHLQENVTFYGFEFTGLVKEAETYAQGILFQDDWIADGSTWRVDIFDEGKWRPLTERERYG